MLKYWIMKILTRYIPALLLSCMAWPANGVPAYPGVRTVVNPDGSVLTLRLLGDEYGHVTVDERGREVVMGADGFWRTTQRDPRRVLARRDRVSGRRVRQVSRPAFPSTGKTRSLVVLVDFPDIEFSTPDIYREIYEMLNLPGFDRREHIGCAADYFRAQSQGQFDPSFDVYGPVRASHPATYYGENDANGDDMRAHELAIELCRKLDGDVDFSQYDMDGDGLIDNLYFFYAGYGENFAGNRASWIWPHAAHIDEWGIPAESRTFDGKTLNSYGCCAELYGSTGNDIAAIGTFCHEFSHILGLPDFYDVNYSIDGSGNHPDQWDIMASGSYLPQTRNCGAVPAGYSAVERWLMGWADMEEIAAPQTVILPPLQSSAQSVRISTADPDEFFVLENRQQSGYDRFLPYHGMLVWHVDRRKDAYINVTVGDENMNLSCADAWKLEYNAVNSNASHQCLEIEKASGNDGGKSTQDTPFPGRQLRTAFTDETDPSMRSWSGVATGKPVTGIAERDGDIRFDFMGGGDPVVVTALEAGEITKTSFVARWEPSGKATGGYTVKLYGVERDLDPDAVTLDARFASLPQGWTCEGEASYSGDAVTLGGAKASSLTTPRLDLSKGGTLTVRASQAGEAAATLKIYAGDELIEQYIPTSQPSDFVIELDGTQAETLTLAVDRRKAVKIGRVTLRQEAESLELTPVQTVGEPGVSHLFAGLEPGKEYAYRVSARGYASSDSQPVFVRLDTDVALDEISVRSAPAACYTIGGFRVREPQPGGIYIWKQGTQIIKFKK